MHLQGWVDEVLSNGLLSYQDQMPEALLDMLFEWTNEQGKTQCAGFKLELQGSASLQSVPLHHRQRQRQRFALNHPPARVYQCPQAVPTVYPEC